MRSGSSIGTTASRASRGRNAAGLWRAGANLVESAQRLMPRSRSNLQRGASQRSISDDARSQCDPVCPTFSGGPTCSTSNRRNVKVMTAIRAARNFRQTSHSKVSSEITDMRNFRERIVNLTGFVGLHQEILEHFKEDERASVLIRLQRLQEELASDVWSIVEGSCKSREDKKPEIKAGTPFKKMTDKRPISQIERRELVDEIEDLKATKKESRQKLCNANAEYLR